MNEQTKPESNPEELTKEQLQKVSGGFDPIDGVVQPPKPFEPIDGYTPIDG